MKVILKQDFELLGDQGQIVEVKNGYARNFLIPNGIAASASASNLKTYEEIRRQKGRKIQKETEEAQKLSSDLSNNPLKIAVKTGDDGKVFGSVTSQMIHDALVEKGFGNIERKKIILKEQIKSLGEHEIDLKLQHSVVAKLKVNVVRENEDVKTEEVETEIPKTEEAQ